MTFTLAQIVREQAAAQPGGEAVACGENRLSWAELDARSSRVAAGLAAAGVGRGDRVGVLARNNAEFFELAFGTAKLGAILLSLNWRLAAAELQQIAADAEPALTVADPDLAPSLQGAADRVLRYGDEYERWRDAMPAVDPLAPVDGGDVAYMLYSSGTTGRPKGVTITHANLALSGRMAREGFRMDAGTVHLCPGPQFHIAGAGTGLMAMFCGGRTVIMPTADPDALLAAIAAERVTHCFMVPAVIQAVIESPALAATDVSSLRQVSYGAAPMTVALLRRAIDALGCGFLGVYGMTETAGTVVTLAPEDHDPGGPRAGLLQSVGQPLPWVELSVRERGTGAPAGPGVVGEICVRSGQVAPGYWRQPELTAAAITEDGWLRTGDGGYRDEHGFLYLRDRIKDMIISGGENVYPAEVENVLADHPGVSEVAVIGVPDERWGEAVMAVVVPVPGRVEPERDELRAFAKTRLAGYKAPNRVVCVDELPRTPSGKVLKHVLRRRFAAAPAGTA